MTPRWAPWDTEAGEGGFKEMALTTCKPHVALPACRGVTVDTRPPPSLQTKLNMLAKGFDSHLKLQSVSTGWALEKPVFYFLWGDFLGTAVLKGCGNHLNSKLAMPSAG